MIRRARALVAIAGLLAFAACGYQLEGASAAPRLIVRLDVPAVPSVEPDATRLLRTALRDALAARGIGVDGGARRTLRVEVDSIEADADLVASSSGTALAGRTRIRASALARLAGAGQAWSVRATGEADAPAPAASRLRAVRYRLVAGALSDLARAIADRLEDGIPRGR